MSRIFRHIARNLRPGLYLLDHPIRIPSSINVRDKEGVRMGGYYPQDIGAPIEYRLHAVCVRGPTEWYGHDEEPPPGADDKKRAAAILPENAALSFSPDELAPCELVRFLAGGRLVKTTVKSKKKSIV